jgi:hypothetical protein
LIFPPTLHISGELFASSARYSIPPELQKKKRVFNLSWEGNLEFCLFK